MEQKTILKPKDKEFISRLRQIGLEKNAQIYLTGSSSGRGGLSRVLKKSQTSYGDMDIIIVSSIPKKALLEIIREQINTTYGHLKESTRKTYVPRINKALTAHDFFDPVSGKKILDFTFGKQVNDSFRKIEYLDRNWFVRVC